MKNLPLANKRFRTSCARAGASESGGTSENICAVRLPEPSEMTTCSRASTGRHQVRMSFLNNQTFLLIVAIVRKIFIKDIVQLLGRPNNKRTNSSSKTIKG